MRDPARIRALDQLAQNLLSRAPTTAQPGFFLASISEGRWAPLVLVTRSAGEIDGLVYLKEHKLGGVPTGLIYGDAILGSLVVAEPGSHLEILREALEFLIAGFKFRGLRLRVAPSFEAVVLEQAAQRWRLDFSKRPEAYHSVITLPDTYPAFLNSLSVNGRRSMRHRRKQFEEGGHSYVEKLDPAEFRRIAHRLLSLSVVGATKQGVDRALRMCTEARHPLLSGLRRSDGEWVAILGGWREDNDAIWFFQMNNERDHPNSSLGTVLRAYFIESQILQSCHRLYFWAGTAGPVARATSPCPSVIVSLDRPTPAWRAIRVILRRLGPRLPLAPRWAVDWIATPDE